MNKRCLYVPTEDGHCQNCGGFPSETCPMTGEGLVYEGTTPAAVARLGDAFRDLAAAIMASPIGRGFRFVSDLVNGTVNDDRA